MPFGSMTSEDRAGRIVSAALLLVLLAGSAIRLAYVDRPLDHRLRNPWRQADYSQISRNFYREDMNIFYPRIDWRGDTPGYAEMEFPLVPWLGAVLHRSLGYREAWLRVVSCVLSIASLLLFLRLARSLLPPSGVLLATAVFASNPLLILQASAMQPEPLMLFFSLLTILFLWEWEATPTRPRLIAAAAACAGAVLAKLPAAYLGLVLAFAVLRKLGTPAFRNPTVWAAGLIAFIPPLMWYLWARQFWLSYGNSLGVSNESHLIGWDMLAPPVFLLGNLKWETLAVFTPAGWILALAALRGSRRSIALPLLWYGSVWIFYLIAARTSGDDWAFYYHTASVPAASLLMGAGLSAFAEGRAIPEAWGRLAVHQRWIGSLVAAGTVVALIGASVVIIRMRDGREDLLAMRTCALQFVSHVPSNGLIVTNGGSMLDEYHRPVAYNESMLFAWVDRKGFNYGDEELGIDTLDQIAALGGRYWIARNFELNRRDFRVLADARYRLLDDCAGGFSLYDLRASPRAR
jgi:4-amino-4-deoxy-L-arabinose transferase-like glycosyltransferase